MVSLFTAQLLGILLSASCSHPVDGEIVSAPPPSQAEFDAHWYDGRAEMNGYLWRGSRYGQMRTGESVAIFVTETMGAKEQVKVDRPGEYRGETLTVLKLNLVRDFQTGIYDYNTMVSAFANVNDMRAVKATFSSAEWCGHVFEQINVRPKGLELDINSYFQAESTHKTLASEPDGIVGDHLFIWLRGLRGHVLEAGATKKLAYLPDSFERRLRHIDAAWVQLTLSREARPVSVGVPAGPFTSVLYHLATSDGRTGSVHIEEAYPHRLLRWSWERDGEVLDSGELTGSRRLEYWKLQDEGQEALRQDIGLDG